MLANTCLVCQKPLSGNVQLISMKRLAPLIEPEFKFCVSSQFLDSTQEISTEIERRACEIKEVDAK